MEDDNIKARIEVAKRFIRKHYGSQRALAKESELSATQISRALNPEKTTSRRLAPIESVMFRAMQKEADDPADEIERLAYRITELVAQVKAEGE